MHTYKEENIRLKREIELIRAGAQVPSSVTGPVSSELVEDLRRELAVLKARNESLQNELMNQELELKTANMSLREKCNDQSVNLGKYILFYIYLNVILYFLDDKNERIKCFVC